MHCNLRRPVLFVDDLEVSEPIPLERSYLRLLEEASRSKSAPGARLGEENLDTVVPQHLLKTRVQPVVGHNLIHVRQRSNMNHTVNSKL